MTSLREAFLAALPERAAPTEEGDLDARLVELVQAARRDGELGIEDEAFVRHVAERLPPGQSPSEGLEGLHAADLYMACACTLGSDRAIAAFHDRVGRVVANAARSSPGDAADEIAQEAMAKLLVGDHRVGPAIAKYSGRGALLHWVRTVTLRLARSRARKRTEEPSDRVELLTDRLLEAGDPELAALKRSYRAQFKHAFRSALAGLSARQRNLLRLELLDRLTIDGCARVYGVHPATISRWRADTRDRLLRDTRRVFERELSVGRDEFQSIMRLIGSQLDVSLPRLLADEELDEPGSQS